MSFRVLAAAAVHYDVHGLACDFASIAASRALGRIRLRYGTFDWTLNRR